MCIRTCFNNHQHRHLSLSSGQFYPILKQSLISPLLKKATLDKDEVSNYRHISNFSPLSKIIECVVKSHLTHHTTFLSIYPSDFDANITLLHNALQHIYCRMTANLLTLNTSKTAFSLIALKRQLAKFFNCSIEITHCARNLGIIFGNT